jgi:D-beta-D-heptose 7-phosphate kinase / D-beta-D-heptose 1-phosphate adenosyltransferase
MSYILRTPTIVDAARQLKTQGRRIVFTHGAFDLFHTGHSYVLEESKRLGDVLIVGVEPDSNIKKYKNDTRPIIDEYNRALIVSKHMATDFVLLIDKLDVIKDNYYLDLYKILSPDFVTIGKNFFARNREKVTMGDIKIRRLKKLVKTPELHSITSTTDIIDKVSHATR